MSFKRCGVEFAQHFKGTLALPIGVLTSARRTFQALLNLLPTALLKVIKRRQSGFLKIVTIMLPEGVTVAYNPRLHARCHEQHLPVIATVRLFPVVTSPEMIPGPFLVVKRIFTINQHSDVIGIALFVCCFEVVIHRIAAAT